jgi:hypothetical protein
LLDALDGWLDVTLEFWFLPYVSQAVAWGATGYTSLCGIPRLGNWPTDTTPAWGFEGRDTPDLRFRGDQALAGGGAATITRTPPLPGWHHYLFVGDGGDQMFLWIDGVGVAAAGAWDVISDIVTFPFVPLIGSGGINSTYDEWHSAVAADYAFPHIHGRLGPIAMYVGLPIADQGDYPDGTAELAQAVTNRYVWSPGDAEVCYDWGRSEPIQGRTCWETDRSRIIRGVSDLPEVDIACPVGTDGDVYVPDISGNDAHFYLRTRTQYDATNLGINWAVAGMACCALGSDPFFQQGGA